LKSPVADQKLQHNHRHLGEYTNLTGLADPEWLGRGRRRGTRGSERRWPGSTAEDRRAAWPRTRLVSELAFEPRPSCRGPSSPTFSPRATSSLSPSLSLSLSLIDSIVCSEGLKP